jgi:hypothetical protein
MEDKRKFTGYIVADEPVTTQKAREAGLIKDSAKGYSVEFSYFVAKEPEEEFRDIVRAPVAEVKEMIDRHGYSFVKHRLSNIISDGRPFFRQVNLDEGVLSDMWNMKINGNINKLLDDLHEDWNKRSTKLGARRYTRENIELKVALIMAKV